MKGSHKVAVLVGLVAVSGQATGQASPGSVSIKAPATELKNWDYTLTMEGYILAEGTSYVNPAVTADHKWLHLEARYNDENLRTTSVWVGYNFGHNADKWEFHITPMLGGVFGRTNGIAPGCEISLNYRKKIEASINNEFVFDLTDKSKSFYYSWPQVTYSPVNWFHVGAVAQHTAAYRNSVNIQRGFLVGFSRKKWEVTTHVFNPGTKATVVVLELGANF